MALTSKVGGPEAGMKPCGQWNRKGQESLNSGQAQLNLESLLPLGFVLSEADTISLGLTAVGFLLLGTEFTLIGRNKFQTALIQALVYILYGCFDPAPCVSLLRTACLVAAVLISQSSSEGENKWGQGRGRIEIERIHLCNFRRALEEPCVEAVCRRSPVFRQLCHFHSTMCKAVCITLTLSIQKLCTHLKTLRSSISTAHAGLVRPMYRIKHPSGNKPVSFTPKSYVRNRNPLSSSFLSDSLLGFDCIRADRPW